MGLLAPIALLFGLLAAPIIALYLLRLRRREQHVSSVFLWQQVLRDMEANVPWQRLRPNLLLFLQLLALAALAAALARPYLSRASQIEGDLFLLLDASASMQATDTAPSRFGAAQERALELVEQLSPGSVASIILVGEVPELLVAQSADQDALRHAIEGAQAGVGGADMQAALSLAASLAQENRPSQAVILSDGGGLGNGDWGIGNRENPQSPIPIPYSPFLPFAVRHESIGAESGNLAIGAFSTRATSIGAGAGLDALARVVNHSGSPAQATLHLYLDGTLYDARPLNLAAGGEVVERWEGLPGAAVLEARLEPGDAFALDDRAWALGGPSGQARVLLVTEGNRFLSKALELHPALEVTTASPSGFSPEADYDLWIFDGFLPPVLPEGALLLVGARGWGLGAGDSPAPSPVSRLRQRGDELLRYVDISSIHVLEAVPLQPPPDARVLLDSSEGPLMALWQEPGHRIAAIAFDIHESDLPLQPTFPILVQNLVGWLLPGLGQGLSVQPGQTVDVPLSPEAESAWLETPSGERVELAPSEPLTLGGPGLYRIVQQVGERELVSFLTANLFSPEESSLAPVALPEVEASDGSGDAEVRFPWELAPLLALGALAVLGLEWWVYNHGR